MKDMKIIDFVEDLASDSPAPGGGAVASLAGALGVALTSMVYNLSLGKKAYENLSDELKIKLDNNLLESKKLYVELIDYIEKDKNAFLSLMECYKLPKNTDDEKNKRKEAIENATINAMNVPMKLAKLTIKFYENIDFAAQYGNKNLISDVAIAGIMVSACVESSIINVEINLSYLKDENIICRIKKEVESLKKLNIELKNNIMLKTSNNINK